MKNLSLTFITFLLFLSIITGSSAQVNNTVLQNCTSGPPGDRNVALGCNAGITATVAQDNVLIGNDAGRNMTSSFNVFVGSGSGSSTTTGTSNLFAGYFSGHANTTGVGNTYLGGGSGTNSTTAQSNTAVGFQSGQSFAGDNNVAVGRFATATGSSNTIVGNNATATGTSLLNSVFGNSASAVGEKNIIIGQSSQATGVANIVIGDDSRIITGNFNTILGGSIPSTSINNTIILADGQGAQRIYVNNIGYTGLGTTTPGNTLEIRALAGSPTQTGFTASGLRLTAVANSNFNPSTAASPNKVLSVNANGDVILVNDIGGGITSACNTANFVTKSVGASGNLTCTSIYDDGLGHVGFGYGSSPNTAFNVSVNGTFATGSGPYNTSDKKFKKDIKPIQNSLATVMKLQGKTYNWRTEEFEELNFRDELQYGLIAQDVQKVLPSIVIESENGNLAMNYIEIIPILVEAIKEQQAQIDDLKNQITENFKSGNSDLINLNNTKIISVSPNPSNDKIMVSLNIEKSVANAKLLVHDLNGVVLSSLNINERDNNITKTLHKDNFGKGIYVVSLVVNGKSIDTKKIIFN